MMMNQNQMNQMNPITLIANEIQSELPKVSIDINTLIKNGNTMSEAFSKAIGDMIYYVILDKALIAFNRGYNIIPAEIFQLARQQVPFKIWEEADRRNIPPKALDVAMNRLSNMGIPIGATNNMPMVNNTYGSGMGSNYGGNLTGGLTYSSNNNVGMNYTGGFGGKPVDSMYDRPVNNNQSNVTIRDQYSQPVNTQQPVQVQVQEPEVHKTIDLNDYGKNSFILAPGLSLKRLNNKIEVVGHSEAEDDYSIIVQEKQFTFNRFTDFLLYRIQSEDKPFNLLADTLGINVVKITKKTISLVNKEDTLPSYFIRFATGLFNLFISPVCGRRANNVLVDKSGIEEDLEKNIEALRYREYAIKKLEDVYTLSEPIKRDNVVTFQGKTSSYHKEVMTIKEKVAITDNPIILEALLKCKLRHDKVITLNKYSFTKLYEAMEKLFNGEFKDEPYFRFYVVNNKGYLEFLVHHTGFAEPKEEIKFKLCLIDRTI